MTPGPPLCGSMPERARTAARYVCGWIRKSVRNAVGSSRAGIWTPNTRSRTGTLAKPWPLREKSSRPS